MKIHEYQAKDLLAAAGATVPKHIVVSTPDEAAAAFDQLANGAASWSKPKSTRAAAARGNCSATKTNSAASSSSPLKRKPKPSPAAMLAHKLQTKQTGPDGTPVHTLIVQEDAKPAKEFYLGMVLDRAIGLPVMMASAEGGMDIEEVAATHPEKILRVPVQPEVGLQPFQARDLAFRLGFTVDQVDSAAKIMLALSKVYFEKDASIAEVNPLAVTESGKVVVLDAKLDFDDNAMFRHKDILALRDLAEENPVEVRASKANLNYIQLDGTIACLVNGAGLAMATMDIINYHGQDSNVGPANFLDVGGGVTPEAATEAFRIILADPKVKGVLVNIFGGIAKCDLIADALVKAGREVGFKVPVVVRLEGTNADKAREILTSVQAELPMMRPAAGLTEAAKLVVELAK